jgi:BolA family transcriptional regulator, general stress-responsive regulator
MSKAKIEQTLKDYFHPSRLLVIDESYKHAGHAGAKEGGHYVVEITAEAFNGKTALERHRMVYAALEPLKHTIHALSIKAN